MAIALGSKSQSNNSVSSSAGLISVDSMIDFIDQPAKPKRSQKKPSDSNDIISVDSMIIFVGDTRNNSKSRRAKKTRSGSRRHSTTRKVAVLLLVMIATTGGLSFYTLNKVEANIKRVKSEASARAADFTESGTPAFTVTTKTMKESTSNLMTTVTETADEQSDMIEHEKRIANFLNCLEDLSDRILANNFWYSNSNNASTYEGALKKQKVTNCARFVSWAMQDAGLIPSGATFWLNTKINGDSSAITNNPNLEVFYPRANAGSIELQPGDVVGWGTAHGQHTAVYAGTDSSGNKIWYSAGCARTRNSGGKRYFTDYIKARPRHSYDNHRIDVIIRIK